MPGVTLLHVSDTQFGRNHRFGRLASADPEEGCDSLLLRLTTDFDGFLLPLQERPLDDSTRPPPARR
jgi:hypothetical protein